MKKLKRKERLKASEDIKKWRKKMADGKEHWIEKEKKLRIRHEKEIEELHEKRDNELVDYGWMLVQWDNRLPEEDFPEVWL